MAETYCGKTCADCAGRAQLNCPGCKVGPAQRFQCECDLAKCCQEKCHTTCDSCSVISRCGLYRSREHMPEYRIKRQQLDAEQAQNTAKRAPFLGKWLWLLFWLIVPSSLASIGSLEVIAAWSPGLYWGATVLGLVCELCYGLILLRISSEESCYKTAGICCLVLTGINIAAPLFGANNLLPPILAIASLVFAVLRIYYEIQAHASVVDGTNDELAMYWRTLWKWLLGAYLAIGGSFVLMLFSALLGSIVLICAAIVVLIARIAELVLLYRTAKWFRNYPDE